MKKYIIILLTICLTLIMVACSIGNKTPNAKENSDIEMNQKIYTDIEKINVYIGESKFCFEESEDVKNICSLFENIVGDEVPSNKIKAEGFYEITFFTTENETHIILTGSTIFIDGIEYYTNKDIIEPLSKYLN